MSDISKDGLVWFNECKRLEEKILALEAERDVLLENLKDRMFPSDFSRFMEAFEQWRMNESRRS